MAAGLVAGLFCGGAVISTTLRAQTLAPALHPGPTILVDRPGSNGSGGGTGASQFQAEALQRGSYEEVKAILQAQAAAIAALKARQLVAEGPYGYLINNGLLDLDQRKVVQWENVVRERLFALIGERTGRSREDVAATFAAMARRAVSRAGAASAPSPIATASP